MRADPATDLPVRATVESGAATAPDDRFTWEASFVVPNAPVVIAMPNGVLDASSWTIQG